MAAQHPFTWTSSSRTDVGMVRGLNEDACIDRPEIGLWAVADGMGGHTAGDVASQMILDTMTKVEPPDTLRSFVDDVEDRLLGVNARLREVATRKHTRTIGSTVAALLAAGQHGLCIWAGDSRIYRYRGGTLEKLTQDHALVQELVGQGILSQEEAAHHPQANLVTRAVGATDTLFLDMEIFQFEHGDLFLLCTDGLDKEVTEEEIAETMARETTKENGANLSNILVDLALSRGARDNVTAVVVSIIEQEAKDRVAPAQSGPTIEENLKVPPVGGASQTRRD